MKKLICQQKDCVIFKPESLKELEALAMVLSSNHRFFADDKGRVWKIGDIRNIAALVTVSCKLEHVCNLPAKEVAK